MDLLNKINSVKRSGPLVLAILDGVGIGSKGLEDAVFKARTPNLDMFLCSPYYKQLKAHGSAVGMPTEADMGNSEVGHNVLGAGRSFSQGAKLVKEAFESKVIFESKTWKALISHAKQSVLHCIGLLSDGNVHAHIQQWLDVLEVAAQAGQKKLRCHILLDGRDVDGRSALGYVKQLESKLEQLNLTYNVDYKIASGGGRMWITMDRYGADWKMVERGWKTHVLAQAKRFESAKQAIEDAYAQDETLNDQYLPAFVVEQASEGIVDGDSVLMMNFRGDRAVELCHAFEKREFKHFDRQRVPKVFFAGMMAYDPDTNTPKHYLVSPPKVKDPMAAYCAKLGLKSLAISETQKYGHVTYFWNGNRSGYVDEILETYIEIPSDTIPFDQQPAMKAFEITDKTIDFMQNQEVDFIRINYPNGDMIGHTGDFDAVVASIEAVDTCVGRLASAVKDVSGTLVLVADHGNADEMFKLDKQGVKRPITAHSLNPVPFKILDFSGLPVFSMANIDQPGLANVTATLFNLLGYEAPAHYETSLIQFDPQ